MDTTRDDELITELRAELPALFASAWDKLAQAEPGMKPWLKQPVQEELDTLVNDWPLAASEQLSGLRAAKSLQAQGSSPPELGFMPWRVTASAAAMGLTGMLAALLPFAGMLLWSELDTWLLAGKVAACVAAVLAGLSAMVAVNIYRPGATRVTIRPLLGLAIGLALGALVWELWRRLDAPATATERWGLAFWVLMALGVTALSVFALIREKARREAILVIVAATLSAVIVVDTTTSGLDVPDSLLVALIVGATIHVVVLPGILALAGFLSAAGGLTPANVWAFVRLLRKTALTPDPAKRQQADAAVEAALAAWREATEKVVVLPYIQRRVSEILAPPFRQPLRISVSPGLHQLSAGDFLIPTEQFTAVRNAVRMVTGGALGVAGPRGAGKSTLLEAYRFGALATRSHEQIVVLESVPVRYEAREFALHLYARLCEEVAAFCERRIRRPVPRRVPWPVLLRAGAAVAGAALAYCAWVLAVIALDKQDLPAWLPPASWPAALLVGGTALAALALSRIRVPRGPAAEAAIDAGQVTDLKTLAAFARQRLRRIRFQQHFTHGWSGKVAIPGGPELTRTNTAQLAELAMTYPDVIHDFRGFLATTVRVAGDVVGLPYPNVAVLIDELDKISSAEKAGEFVNEVKALFSPPVEGCLFVVAVSEDALAAFHRRGLPVRDEFDSAFDTIARVGYLSMADSFNVVRSRVMGLGLEHLTLIHVLAGGLPRDLIRVTRAIVRHQGAELAELARAVIAEDVRDKMDALRTVIVRHDQPEPHAGVLIHQMDSVSAATPTELEGELRRALSAGSDRRPDDASFAGLVLETLGHFYLSLTLLEVFAGPLTELDLTRADFESLARARQLFAVNTLASWRTVDAFRVARGLAQYLPGQEAAE
ncbi:hypothetical protein [Nonomuraea typhae]|uniref:hypothetical protein n=1 Tax=Nonomuraea typhae TaxID=2603600 RepID=UPI0012F91D1F|nr:hypothetical protein [Nonomuraea typhae]